MTRSLLQAQPAIDAQIRFMTAGSVDDGKSTLIGRLLLDSGAVMRDQLDALGRDGGDLALLTDGLEAERAQGITIDVAYRYFSTPQASFVIADAPGHEQYTRNMVTAASNSDLAVIVIDASRVEHGELRPQTRRHARIATLMSLDMVVAVNKMDLVDWSQARFAEVAAAFTALARSLGRSGVACVPISARNGDNVVKHAADGWWTGPTLIDAILRGGAPSNRRAAPLRLPVQTVLRSETTRHYAGRIESGVLRPGDVVAIGASGQTATIAGVRVGGKAVARAEAGASVAVALTEERGIARGDVIAACGVTYTRSLAADLCWLDEKAWKTGRRVILRQGSVETPAIVDKLDFIHDIGDFSRRLVSETLQLNDMARVRITTRDPVLADLYDEAPGTGAFALFDPDTNQTLGAGMIRENLA